jgi:formylmethanofuran dehydrogenase subunit E
VVRQEPHGRFQELAAGVETYTPKWAADITQIPEATIYRIAHEFAENRPNAFAHPGWRTSNFVNSFQTERAIAVLNALLGLCPEKGDRMFPAEPAIPLGKPDQPAYPPVRAARLDGVPWKYKFVPPKLGVFQELRDAILSGQPYQAQGWFIARQNPMMSLTEREKTLAAFQKLGLVVVMDILMNDSAWYADVVLPEATYLERYDPLLQVGNRVFIRQPVIEPLGQSRSALWIYRPLGERLGLGDFFQYEDEVDYIRQQLLPWTERIGVTLDQLQQTGYFEVPGEDTGPSYRWDTSSGKVELASGTLRNAGYDPIPTWVDPPEPKDSEFHLLTARWASIPSSPRRTMPICTKSGRVDEHGRSQHRGNPDPHSPISIPSGRIAGGICGPLRSSVPASGVGRSHGTAGWSTAGPAYPPNWKAPLTVIDTDGCATGGVSVATGCTVGHRTLRVIDFGKVAATFIDVETGEAFRVLPHPESRLRALDYAPTARTNWQAQLEAYQIMPDGDLLAVLPVRLRFSLDQLLSKPGCRVTCEACGEEINNEREVVHEGRILCRACAGYSYYHLVDRRQL